MSNPTSVAILVRVSSKSDRQDYDRQISDLTKVAKKNNWQIVKIVTAKISATKTRLSTRQDIAELETVRLSECIKSGLREARQKGKQIGRPEGSTADMAELIKTNPKYKTAAKSLREGTSLRKTAAFAGISVNTVSKIKEVI